MSNNNQKATTKRDALFLGFSASAAFFSLARGAIVRVSCGLNRPVAQTREDAKEKDAFDPKKEC